MTGMTTKSKIAVSLPTDVLDSARAQVRAGRAPSMSSYVAEALKQRTESDDLDHLLATMLAETGGPLTDEERAQIDREAGWQ